MLTNPIVLILGAGASADYGFPTGDQLTQRIHELLTRDDGYMAVLESAGLNHDRLCRFRNASTVYSPPPSARYLCYNCLRPLTHPVCFRSASIILSSAFREPRLWGIKIIDRP